MSKNIITIVSVILVIVGSVCAYSYLNKGQEDTQLDILNIHKINNTASFLWIDEQQDETVFYISGIEMEIISSNPNPYFEMLFNVKDVTNNNYSTAGFSFSTKIGSFSDNKLRIYYNDLSGDNEIEVKVKVNTNIVEEGNYFIDVQLNNGTFDLSKFNSGVALRLGLEVNEKTALLKIWLSILLVITILSLGVWFILLKKMYYPTFSNKGQLNISEPELLTIFLNKNARKLIIGNKLKVKDSFLTKLFIGEIQHEFQDSNHSAVISPYEDWKTKKIFYRLSYKGDTNSEIVNAESYMKHLDKYKLSTNEEIISFEYFNIKHY